jgi:spore maturation protein SpmA
MALNYIWFFFFISAFVIGLIKLLFFGDMEVFPNLLNSTFSSAKVSIEIAVYLIGVMTLWLGIMKIGEHGGAVRILSKLVGPFFSKLFPEIPKNHPASGAMLMNFSANMLGLDNAATPLGLKAMNELQSVNHKKDTASNAQIMFLVLNTSGLTIVPVSILAIRAAKGSVSPAEVFIPILLATFFASLGGLMITAIYQKINLFNKIILAYLGGITLFILGLMYFFSTLTTDQISVYSNLGGNLIIFSFIISFMLLAWKNKINMYESFIEGAKEGFDVAVKIIPFLVAMLVGIGVFRASGAMDIILNGISKLVIALGVNADFIPALPTAMMKPLSGSGARGMMVEAMDFYGVDSFVGKLAATFQGSTETTFYTLAVYFGAVSIRKTRHALVCGLVADAVGIISAIFIAYMFYS